MRGIHIFGGGTVEHVRPHLALCAPAYGTAARRLATFLESEMGGSHRVYLELTRMAGGPLETAADVARRLDDLVADPRTHVVVMSAAICDFRGALIDPLPDSPGIAFSSMGRSHPGGLVVHDERPPLEQTRLSSSAEHRLLLSPVEKLLDRVRRDRKDIFLVGFKTTAGYDEDAQFQAGLRLLKRASCNLVLANDIRARRNMVVTPEQSRYAVTEDRDEALRALAEMAAARSAGAFARTTVVSGDLVDWEDPLVPPALRRVVDFCRAEGAFRAFDGKTVGHFGCRLGDDEFLFSRRKVDFNDERRLVACRAVGDKVVAVGAKPSAGAATQRQLFADHPGYDCVVHFHCPLREGAALPVRPQRGFECGSLQCGENTSAGMAEVGPGVKAVYLDQHGPNVLFRGDADPAAVCRFIADHFDLRATTRSAARGSARTQEVSGG